MTKRFASALLIGATAVAVAACSPQLENPSEEKVPTAIEQDTDTLVGSDFGYELPETYVPSADDSVSAAPTTLASSRQAVSFVDCVAAPVQQPSQVTVDCADPVQSIVGIEWTAWGDDEAIGTGTDQATGAQAEVVLSEITQTPDGVVYNSITVDGAVITP